MTTSGSGGNGAVDGDRSRRSDGSDRSDRSDRGRWHGDRYQERFDSLAASGVDVHGEAGFVADLDPVSVLDAGCGTGRVARELARRGIEVVGVDLDQSMIATARRLAPDITWVQSDVAELDLGRRFDVVVMAGNVPLFAAEGSREVLVAGCARHLVTDGALVAGFQLDERYPLATYDMHCGRAGLACAERWATWSRDPFVGGTYAVSVHRRSIG
jgi:SAM-dependent methyltransferase